MKMPRPLRYLVALTAICIALLVAPGFAAAHGYDPYDAEHSHVAREAKGGGTSPVIVVAVVVLMLGTAAALIGLRRVGRGPDTTAPRHPAG